MRATMGDPQMHTRKKVHDDLVVANALHGRNSKSYQKNDWYISERKDQFASGLTPMIGILTGGGLGTLS